MSTPLVIPAASRVQPFLKWAGGKRQLLQELRRFVPASFRTYHEPFLGSGAVFFDLWHTGALTARFCNLADINVDLIGCYRALARDVDAVIRELRRLAADHARSPQPTYYRVRDELFNPLRRTVIGANEVSCRPDMAAMFIYLNRTGYNGLFRLNSSGDFNVPMGRYERPVICDEARLRAVAAVLSRASIELRQESFVGVASRAQAEDLIYLDPPYAPLSATARFTSYTGGGFSEADQRSLHRLVVDLVRRGCWVVLSNSTAPIVTALYEAKDARQAGLRAYRVPARRAINSNSARRGYVHEYVVTNVPRIPPARN